jgi:hypothetical protein
MRFEFCHLKLQCQILTMRYRHIFSIIMEFLHMINQLQLKSLDYPSLESSQVIVPLYMASWPLSYEYQIIKIDHKNDHRN